MKLFPCLILSRRARRVEQRRNLCTEITENKTREAPEKLRGTERTKPAGGTCPCFTPNSSFTSFSLAKFYLKFYLEPLAVLLCNNICKGSPQCLLHQGDKNTLGNSTGVKSQQKGAAGGSEELFFIYFIKIKMNSLLNPLRLSVKRDRWDGRCSKYKLRFEQNFLAGSD